MILRISSLVALLAAAGQLSPSSAFQSQPIIRTSPTLASSLNDNGRLLPSASSAFPAASALRMSSIPDDKDDVNFSPPSQLNKHLDDENKLKFSLPPAPEDLIALTGDVVSLFVYSYMDHMTNEIYADTAAKMDVADLVAYDPAVNPTVSLPVWFDPDHLQTFGSNWLARAAEVPYAPVIAHSGLAFVTISTCWLLVGHFFTGAFMNANTLGCKGDKAMMVTLKTWAGTALLMILLAWGSDALWGMLDENFNALSAPARGGLTKVDADFIFDSLSVLAWWRFMFNWLLGYR